MSEKPRALNSRMDVESEVPGPRRKRDEAKGNYKIETRIAIQGIEDIVEARQQGRALARDVGFSMTQCTLVATVISELARNIVLYAGAGEIVLGRVNDGEHAGLIISAIDEGPGISDIQSALMTGYSSAGGLGLGLPGVRRIMDEFDITSSPDQGTHITTALWL